jgi:hypothetical protein
VINTALNVLKLVNAIYVTLDIILILLLHFVKWLAVKDVLLVLTVLLALNANLTIILVVQSANLVLRIVPHVQKQNAPNAQLDIKLTEPTAANPHFHLVACC